MTVKDLRKALNDYPDDMEVLTKKTELLGNVGYVNSIKEDSYGFFGRDIPCVLLTDVFEPDKDDKDELIKAMKYDRDQYTKGYKDGVNNTLDKIRAEIEQRSYGIANDSVIQGMKYERGAILEIIDKYKIESESHECCN